MPIDMAVFLVVLTIFWAATSRRALLQTALEVGPLKMDWRDIIALAVVVIVLFGIYTHQLSVERALAVLAGLLLGKLVLK